MFFFFLVKSIEAISQGAGDTPSRAPTHTISHFALVDFKPERSSKLSNVFITSIAESSSPTKECCIVGISRRIIFFKNKRVHK